MSCLLSIYLRNGSCSLDIIVEAQIPFLVAVEYLQRPVRTKILELQKAVRVALENCMHELIEHLKVLVAVQPVVLLTEIVRVV